jgi:hypothetical protein
VTHHHELAEQLGDQLIELNHPGTAAARRPQAMQSWLQPQSAPLANRRCEGAVSRRAACAACAACARRGRRRRRRARAA